MTILFFDDYSEGAHPRILEALASTNLQQQRGYSADFFTHEAERLIQEKINCLTAKVHFVASGTQANLVCLASLLKSYESVIAASNGHINVHEAGAIEATGHKINIVPGVAGKLTPEAVQEVVDVHHDDQMVQPKVVYISQSTELGTFYTKTELQKLSAVCKRNHLYLYLDGARIGNALMAEGADFNLSDIAELCDMFYLGGTKNGALMGEAIVIINPSLQSDFGYHLRQRGALLAKARSVSIQFLELFRDTLYFDNARHANLMAKKLAAGIHQQGYGFLHPPSTNLIFPILPDAVIKKLQKKFGFYIRSKDPAAADYSVIRLVCSWATLESSVNELTQAL